jgi:hypothetical protein
VVQNHNVAIVSAVTPVWLQEVLNSYAVDSEAQQLLKELAISSPNEQGVLFIGWIDQAKGEVMGWLQFCSPDKDNPSFPFFCIGWPFWHSSYFSEDSEIVLLEGT